MATGNCDAIVGENSQEKPHSDFSALWQKFKAFYELSQLKPDREDIKAKYLEARNKIVTDNLALISVAARKYKSPTFTYDEIKSICHLALINAVYKYSPEKGEFSNFAIEYLKGYIKMELSSNNQLVSIPFCTIKKRKRFEELTQTMSESEALRTMGYKKENTYPKRIKCLQATSKNLVSLQEMVANDPQGSNDLIPDSKAVQPIDELIRQERIEQIKIALQFLSEREREIVYARANGETLKEIGDKFGGLSKERVRQIERDALNKLKKLVA